MTLRAKVDGSAPVCACWDSWICLVYWCSYASSVWPAKCAIVVSSYMSALIECCHHNCWSTQLYFLWAQQIGNHEWYDLCKFYSYLRSFFPCCLALFPELRIYEIYVKRCCARYSWPHWFTLLLQLFCEFVQVNGYIITHVAHYWTWLNTLWHWLFHFVQNFMFLKTVMKYS